MDESLAGGAGGRLMHETLRGELIVRARTRRLGGGLALAPRPRCALERKIRGQIPQ
jgi:hypothetical protein